MLVRQARPFLPLMFIASEPHTPSRQERRKTQRRVDRLELASARRAACVRAVEFDLQVCMRGFASLSGRKR